MLGQFEKSLVKLAVYIWRGTQEPHASCIHSALHSFVYNHVTYQSYIIMAMISSHYIPQLFLLCT